MTRLPFRLSPVALAAIGMVFFLIGATGASAASWPTTVTDLAGRTVTIAEKPKAILLGTGFDLVTLSLVHPDPVSLLAGWSQDLRKDNPVFYADFVAKFPAIADVPDIGSGIAGAISLETAISLDADLAIMPLWQASSDLGKQAIDYLESAGVTVVVIDFTEDPLKNTAASMRLVGHLLEREEQAEAFARFHEEKLALIRSRIEKDGKPGPTVFMDAFPKPDQCCWAYGLGGFGELLTVAGGRNIADGSLPLRGGAINTEYVMGANPEVYIATSTPGGAYSNFEIGPGVAMDVARTTLGNTVATPVLSGSSAVENSRVHGLWSYFNTVPLNILAVEAFAKWLRPELFADLDPDRSLSEINDRFAAVPLAGTFWVDIEPGQP